MPDDLQAYERRTFESIKHVDENGNEIWSARQLAPLLGYKEWRYFAAVVEKAKEACAQSGNVVDNHFGASTQMVTVGSGAKVEQDDVILTRYAAYLVAQNGNPRFPEIAQAMTYFAEQTRRHELAAIEMTDQKRLDARKKLTTTEKKFAGVVMDRGVDRFGLAEIKAVGDQHLFGGHSTQDMKNKYGVKGKKPLADVLPTVSLKAKDLATEMTTVNTELKNLKGKNPIGNEHVQNNDEVREALLKRGIKIENLPAEEDIKKVERRIKADEKRRLMPAEKPLKIDNPNGFDDTIGKIAKAGK